MTFGVALLFARRRQRTVGLVRSATAMHVVMQAMVGIRLGWVWEGGQNGEWEGGSWDGSGKVWSARSHGEAAGVHLFCLHAAKEFRSGQLTGLFAGTEGGTLHAESPNKGVSSSLLGGRRPMANPNPKYPRTIQPTGGQPMAGCSAAGALHVCAPARLPHTPWPNCARRWFWF